MKRFFLPLLLIFVLGSCDKADLGNIDQVKDNKKDLSTNERNNSLGGIPYYYPNCKTDNRINVFNDAARTLIWKGSGSENYIYYGTDLSGTNINTVITASGDYARSYDGITGVSINGVKHIAYMGLSGEIFYGYENPSTTRWTIKRIGPNWKTNRQPAICNVDNTVFVFWVGPDSQIWYTTPALADQGKYYAVTGCKSPWGLYAVSQGHYITLLLKGNDGSFYLVDGGSPINGKLYFYTPKVIVQNKPGWDITDFIVSFNMFSSSGLGGMPDFTINFLDVQYGLGIDYPYTVTPYSGSMGWGESQNFLDKAFTQNAPIFWNGKLLGAAGLATYYNYFVTY